MPGQLWGVVHQVEQQGPVTDSTAQGNQGQLMPIEPENWSGGFKWCNASLRLVTLEQ